MYRSAEARRRRRRWKILEVVEEVLVIVRLLRHLKILTYDSANSVISFSYDSACMCPVFHQPVHYVVLSRVSLTSFRVSVFRMSRYK